MRESINGTNAEYASVEDLNMHFLRFQIQLMSKML